MFTSAFEFTRRCGAEVALVAVMLSAASAQVKDLGPRPAGDVVLQEQKLPPANTKQPYKWSLCQGEDKVMPRNQECGGPFHPSHAVTGGNPPYHFQLDTMGGFPPFGIHLDKDGNLTGSLSKGARGSTFRVCAVDLSGSPSCQTMSIDVPATAGTSHALRNGLIIGGAAAGAAVGIGVAAAGGGGGGGGSCASLSNQCHSLSSQCLNGISSACSQVDSVCTQYCQCSGFSGFNVGTGSCQ